MGQMGQLQRREQMGAEREARADLAAALKRILDREEPGYAR